MAWSHPVSLLPISLFWAIMAVGAAFLIRSFARNRGERRTARKSWRSTFGIALQAIGFATAALGPVRATLPWSNDWSIGASVAVVLLGGAGVAIFAASSAAMGRNWSIVARLRDDHQLVRTGPFAVVRHPIYLALLLELLALGVALGHFAQLLVAGPVYCAGAAWRIREEEKLLRAKFGDDHARYVREVPAFIPFIG